MASPPGAEAFADRYDPYGYTDDAGGLYLIPWQMIARQDGMLVSKEQNILIVGSWLLALLAVASLAVLVGGRMAEQNRRVGLLKAVGAAPALVAGILLGEYLALSVVAAAIGLIASHLAAPLLTNPGAGLLGTAGAPQLTASTVGLVVAVAAVVACLATFSRALRAAPRRVPSQPSPRQSAGRAGVPGSSPTRPSCPFRCSWPPGWPHVVRGGPSLRPSASQSR